MKDLLIAKKSGERPLQPLFVGWEQCKSGHCFGPHIREHYLIHFVLSGKGCLWDKNGEHTLHAGELFVIRPGEVTVYKADEQEPWYYCWIAFKGEDAAPFSACASVLRSPGEIAERLNTLAHAQITTPEIYLALLYELLYSLFCTLPAQVSAEDRLQEICRYIRYNYMNDLRVSELSRLFGFERSYLYRLFKEHLQISVKDYITDVRMKHAEEFLLAGHAVGQTARMVGYEDVLVFSHAFKKYFGKTATQLRARGSGSGT